MAITWHQDTHSRVPSDACVVCHRGSTAPQPSVWSRRQLISLPADCLRSIPALYPDHPHRLGGDEAVNGLPEARNPGQLAG